MSIEHYLIIFLAVLVVVLIILLLVRHLREKKRLAVIRNLSLNEFSNFLIKNSQDGTVVEVARKVSDLLIKSFGCRHILFLRKKRNKLELNYYYGINRFVREEMAVPFTEELSRILKSDFLPRELNSINYEFPKALTDKFKQFNIDRFFPVFWKDNLYGVYFIKSNLATESTSFKILIGAVAQSLSAAYHIKWHESKYENLQKQLTAETNNKSLKPDESDEFHQILKLMKHRKADTIIPRLLTTYKELSHLDKIALIYTTRDSSETPMIIKENLHGNLPLPDKSQFDKLISGLTGKEYLDVDKLIKSKNNPGEWLLNFRKRGLTSLALFTLGSGREAVILWPETSSNRLVLDNLKFFSEHSSQIIENAESYEKIEELSYTDSLTGLANQRYFFKRLDEEINRANRYQRHLALVIFDIDELKQVNDVYGHLAGDAAIRQIGELLRKSIRSIDVIARYGGDEFCIIMPESDEAMSRQFMNRFTAKIGSSPITLSNYPDPIYCSVSMGAAIYPRHAESSKKLIFSADMALLKAKEDGRNTFKFAPEKTGE